MSSFLYRWGRACFRRRWTTVGVWMAILALCGGLAVGLGDTFDDEFSIPGASSQAALEQLRRTFPEVSGVSATLLVVAPDGASVSSPEIRTAVEEELADVAQLDWVQATLSPWSPVAQGLVSSDGRAAMASIRIPTTMAEVSAGQRAELTRAGAELQQRLGERATVQMGGEVFSASLPTITLTEGLGLVVALIVLVFTLGSLVAAMIPVATALLGVAVAMGLTFAGTGLLKISSTTPLLAVMLGLAVGIDYALFILSRHRDQLATGLEAEESAAQAVATAGSAVVFAGLTVVIALVGLSVANIPFLAVMGIFAAVAVAIAVLVALSLVPALMGLVGERMRPQPRRRRRAAAAERDPDADRSRWWVRVVTRFPLVTILVVLVGMGALSFPAKDMALALPNSGHNAPQAADRQVFDAIGEHFGPGYNGQLIVTATLVQSSDPLGIMAGLTSDIEQVPGVAKVLLSTPNQNADTGIVQIVPTTGPDEPATADLVRELRSHEDQWRDRLGTDTAVTGFTAAAIDVSDRLGGALLPFAIFVVGLSLVLLTMVFRSIWVPIKASLGYLLSVGGAMGATTLVFNRGVGAQVINLHQTGPIISFFPIILMGILFGLAMDYEVFLVSRMREEHVHGDDARTAVKDGFVHSAKVVVAAALIMFAVFAFFVPEGEGPIKPIAFGLAVGVALDAFVVRMTLVPAVMHLLGERAWYLPRWLDRLLPSFDIEGEGLRHQLALADWPREGDLAPVHAEGLVVEHRGQRLLDDVHLRLEPGDVLVVTGPPLARAALTATLSGRLVPSAGQARVAGHLLATEAGRIRAAVSHLDGAAIDLRDVRTGGVVVVDDADRLVATHPEALARLVAELDDGALVLSATNPAVLEPALPAHLTLPLEGAVHATA